LELLPTTGGDVPNGHQTGSFFISKSDLIDLLSGWPDSTLVAECAGGMRRAAVAELLRLLEQFEGENIHVVQRDFSDYQFYLDYPLQQFVLRQRSKPPREADVSTWIVVKPDSPLFGPLRDRYHTTGRSE
jgi:hypothetical protein